MDEETRRVLSSLLSEVDGLSSGKKGEFVLFLASTNTLWDIDDAVISRFEKRILIYRRGGEFLLHDRDAR